MKLIQIEFENFRNFKDRGEIKFSTDGKITIIYGKNGDGKTTLHQLLQWVFYNKVNFNKTTTNRLYNLKYESERSYGETFDVMGRVDFEHENRMYSLTRKYTYRKGIDDSEKVSEDVSLNVKTDSNDWKPVEKPSIAIEKMLPSALLEYFFFDGESMIADLRVKEKDSATKLRKALYSMFDLDVLESAISHIGRTDLKTTVLGKLYLSKGTISSGSKISAIRTNIENAQNKMALIEEQIAGFREEKSEKHNLILEISEKIGNSKSKEEYERQRKELKKQRDIFLSNAQNSQSQFGDDVIDMFPKLLISKTIKDAKKKIHLKIEENKLPSGVTKPLIDYLLSGKTTTCICGNPLCNDEINHIKEFLEMLPPRSFTKSYNEFTNTAKHWGAGYSREKIEKNIISVLENLEQAGKCDDKIRELDNNEKKSPDIEQMIIDRQKAEIRINKLEKDISDLNLNYKKLELYLKQQMKQFDQLTSETDASIKVMHKIQIMQDVSKYFSDKLEIASSEYSNLLEENIQSLINKMLTSKRKVSVSSEFSVRVTDSYDDESKSEGQFAVVSFAYIGGILKLLNSNENLSKKEYPLVLDGPFSKLDAEQRENVIDTIPDFAPQVILFSKDDLQSIVKTQNIGRVWTIVSNEEKNIANVREGYLWK